MRTKTVLKSTTYHVQLTGFFLFLLLLVEERKGEVTEMWKDVLFICFNTQ